MTLSLLQILVGALLLYCAIICVQLLPALRGQSEPGKHCTGSLLALAIGVISYFIAALFGGAAIGAILAKLSGKKASTKPSPTPTPNPPTPGPTPGPTPPTPPEPTPPGIELPGPGGVFA